MSDVVADSDGDASGLISQPAPEFAMASIQGETVRPSDYRGRNRLILWFSRGFTCNFCRSYMEGIIRPYGQLQELGVEVLQIAPNLLDTARRYFQPPPPYPFICDPDKRLYALYGLGDRGALSALGNTVVTFGHAFTHGQGLETVRASWLDVANRDFVRRLHHHALTALDQAIFVVDLDGTVRHQRVYRALEPIPDGEALAKLTLTHCP